MHFQFRHMTTHNSPHELHSNIAPSIPGHCFMFITATQNAIYSQLSSPLKETVNVNNP